MMKTELATIWLALIAVLGTSLSALIVQVVAPFMLARQTNLSLLAKQAADYARQDAVAAQVSEAARLLLVANQRVDSKLDVIHGLVNSQYTAALQSDLDARIDKGILMREVIALKKTAGQEPSPEALALLEANAAKIEKLRETITDRERQAKANELRMSRSLRGDDDPMGTATHL